MDDYLGKSIFSRYYSNDPWERFWAEQEMRTFDHDLWYFLRERDPLYKY